MHRAITNAGTPPFGVGPPATGVRRRGEAYPRAPGVLAVRGSFSPAGPDPVAPWICPWPNGHLQATGVDAAGRRQYRYHEAWTARRDREKFDRALQLGLVLPELRARLARDLQGRGLTRTRVLSCAVRLIDLGLFRVGGEEYADPEPGLGVEFVPTAASVAVAELLQRS